MTEKFVPYWVGNVAEIRFPSKAFRLVPDPDESVYGQVMAQTPSAKIFQFPHEPKK